MAAHPTDSAVLQSGCFALGELASSGHADAVAAPGGVEKVIAAMTTHLRDFAVQSRGCFALGKLASGGHAHPIVTL